MFVRNICILESIPCFTCITYQISKINLISNGKIAFFSIVISDWTPIVEVRIHKVKSFTINFALNYYLVPITFFNMIVRCIRHDGYYCPWIHSIYGRAWGSFKI